MAARARSAVQIEKIGHFHPVQYHAHGQAELLLVTDGALEFGMHGEVRRMQPGDALLCAPYVMHAIERADADAAGVRLLFDPAVYGKEAGRALEAFSCADTRSTDAAPETAAHLREIIRTICAEAETEGGDRELVVCAALWELAVLATREMPRLGQRASALCPAQSMLREIAQRYRAEFSLAALAETLDMSVYYLSLLFAQKFGVSFVPYLTRLRVRHVAWLLRNAPEMSVSDAARDAGFGSIQTFNRVFHNYMGMSPTAFRAQAREEAAN